jgi:hypothetical protein
MHHRQLAAVIYFQTKGSDPADGGRLLVSLLQSGKHDFRNAFTAVEASGIRQRFYRK